MYSCVCVRGEIMDNTKEVSSSRRHSHSGIYFLFNLCLSENPFESEIRNDDGLRGTKKVSGIVKSWECTSLLKADLCVLIPEAKKAYIALNT